MCAIGIIPVPYYYLVTYYYPATTHYPVHTRYRRKSVLTRYLSPSCYPYSKRI